MSAPGIGGAPADQEDPRADLIWGTIPRAGRRRGARHGDTEALVDGDVRLTYAELAEAVDRYARGFMAAGVGRRRPGGHLGAQLRRVDAGRRWAALRAGAVLVPLNTRFKGGEAAYILRDARGPRCWSPCAASSGVDYPAMLRGQDAGDLGAIVLLRDEGGGGRRRGDAGARPVIGLGRSLPGRRGASTRPSRRRGPPPQARRLSDLDLHLGHHRAPQGRGHHPRPVAAHLRHLGLHRRARAGDRYLVVNPFFHTFGYKAGILACLMAGATVVPEPVFDAPR